MKTYGIALVLGAVLAIANHMVLTHHGFDLVSCAPCLALVMAGPFVLALLVAVTVVATVPTAPAPAGVTRAPEPPAEPADHAALRLLATLQEEGRLVDFSTEDLNAYSDEQIGAATRGIHESCRKALHAAVTVEPVMSGEEGATVTIPAGFDPAAIRLVGAVSGTPPFTGVLRHAGWRATAVNLPKRSGHDPQVIAPAEVEIG